ncbi:MAG: chloride channel protein, partial [Clostridia bacterium]|nr:chloride channel protein [Clostridia bacterium]
LFKVAITSFEMTDIWIPLLLGVSGAVGACGYNLFVFVMGKVWGGKLRKVPQWAKLMIVFGLTAVVGVIAVGSFDGTNALFGGGGLIVKLTDAQMFSWYIIFILLLMRFFMIAFSTSSGATGGVFIPMLSIGALLGALCGKWFMAMGMSEKLYPTVVMLCMTAFMGAATRAPLTALVFMVECTWDFSNLFYVGITVFVSYLICELVKVEPLYDVLLERMLEQQNEGKQHTIVELQYVVGDAGFAVGKSIRDVLWPANTKVTHVEAGDRVKRMDDDGEKKIYAGDKLTLITQTYDLSATKKELHDILGANEITDISADTPTDGATDDKPAKNVE